MNADGMKSTRSRAVRPARPIIVVLCAAMFGLMGCDGEPTLRTVERTTDQARLAEIATDTSDQQVRRATVRKLTEQGLALAAEQTADLQQRTFLFTVAKFVRAANALPADHGNRILSEVMPLAGAYSGPEWLDRFGALETLWIEWSPRGQQYIGQSGGSSIGGEHIAFTAIFTRADRPLRAT